MRPGTLWQRDSARQARGPGGLLLFALASLAAWSLHTAIALRDPLQMILEWELAVVFMRPETHGWYRTVMTMVACDVLTGAFTVAGMGWLLLLAWRRSARFVVHVQAWLVAIVVMRTGACLIADHMTHAIGIDIGIPSGGFFQALLAAALGIPYFRLSRRVRAYFIET